MLDPTVNSSTFPQYNKQGGKLEPIFYESDMQEFSAPSRATLHIHHRILHLNLSSVPIFPYTFTTQSTLYHLKLFLLHPSTRFDLSLPHLPSTPDSYNFSLFICSSCPNHLKAHLSAFPDGLTCTPALLLISSFLILSLTVTPHTSQTFHFNYI